MKSKICFTKKNMKNYSSGIRIVRKSCEHTAEKSFEKQSEEDYCGDEIMTCSKCSKEISRTPVHEHDYVVTDYPASINYQCRNCDYGYEEAKNPFGK